MWLSPYPRKPARFRVVVQAAGSVLPIEAIRAQCEIVAIDGVDSDGTGGTHPDDGLLLGYLRSAASLAEAFLGSSIAARTYQAVWDCFPRDCMEIPVLPFGDIVSFTAGPAGSDQVVVDESEYTIDQFGDPWLTPATLYPVGNSWPAFTSARNGVQVTFTAGYPLDSNGDATGMPDAIKQALLLLVGDWYLNREDTIDGRLGVLPNGAQFLLRPFRYRLGMA